MVESTGTRKRTAKPSEDRRKRGNGTGSVYPYRAGFRAAFTWRDDGGRLHRSVVSAATRDAAERKLAAPRRL